MDGMTTPLTAVSRSASPLGLLDLSDSVLLVEGIAVIVVGAKASLAMAKACMSGVVADGRPMLNLRHVIMSSRSSGLWLTHGFGGFQRWTEALAYGFGYLGPT